MSLFRIYLFNGHCSNIDVLFMKKKKPNNIKEKTAEHADFNYLMIRKCER